MESEGRPRYGMMIAGATTWATVYMNSVVISAQERQSYAQGWGYVPVLGPLVAATRVPSGGSKLDFSGLTFAPERAEDDQPGSAAAAEVVERAERPWVGPVQVVEYEDYGRLLLDRADQRF